MFLVIFLLTTMTTQAMADLGDSDIGLDDMEDDDMSDMVHTTTMAANVTKKSALASMDEQVHTRTLYIPIMAADNFPYIPNVQYDPNVQEPQQQ
ncbi:hypothetical protein HDE_01488 [Halotydeus destructor]|nr:hypothetical protein HDE_01488 [Halotydeus destructor]